MDKIPTTIVSGFLGAGKTTVISHLIDTLQERGELVAYVKNEIGDADVDTQIIQRQQIATKQLLNGCICCTLTGPFISAIDELIDSVSPTRIIIEASGTADVAAVALLVSGHQKLTRDGVLTIIDVVNFEGFDDLSITAQHQTEFTDIIIFNKIELVSLERKRAVVGYVRELNTHAPIIEAPHGIVHPDVVFGVSSPQLEQLLAAHDPHTLHDHEQRDAITGFHLLIPDPLSTQVLKSFVSTLPANIFRVKGIVNTTDSGTVLIQKVGTRIDLQSLTDRSPAQHSILVCIGYQAASMQSVVTQSLEQAVRESASTQRGHPDLP